MDSGGVKRCAICSGKNMERSAEGSDPNENGITWPVRSALISLVNSMADSFAGSFQSGNGHSRSSTSGVAGPS